jgi:glycosyltransferase involved in cell wall biosynthesis
MSVKILQTIKYFYPSKGGMESVLINMINGVLKLNNNVDFTVYTNNHVRSYVLSKINFGTTKIIQEPSLLKFKSQPIKLFYSNLNKLIKDSDIVHHHFPFPNMELSLLLNLNLLKKKKFIITWHANVENTRWGKYKWFYFLLVGKLLKVCDSIVVTSPQLLENSELLNKFRSKVVVIPLSFNSNISLNKPVKKKYLVGDKFKVLFVGKLRDYKGLKYLISAFREIDAQLTIVGDGELESELKELVKDLFLEKKIIFLKGLSDIELYKTYQEAHLFVLPSINEAEAFGLVQLEAMAFGLPVINTNLKSGVPFVSISGQTGLTVDPKSIDQLSSVINLIINDSKLYKKFSVNALTRSSLFSEEIMAKSYLSLFEKYT